MVTPRIPERAVVRRTHNPPPHTEQELFLFIRALQSPIQNRRLLEWMKLKLHKLPPSQPPLPSILPQFNPGLPLQYLPSSSVPPGIIPQRRITPIEETHLRTSSTHNIFDFDTPLPPDPVEERHIRRLADLENLLGPLNSENDDSGDEHKLDDSGCVLLCWGSSSDCRVLVVNYIGRTIDQELFWKKLQTAWYDTRGRWRQKMPWYGIRSVKQVEIRLVGPDPKANDIFHGVYQLADKALETEKQKLRERMSKARLPDYDDLEYEYLEYVCQYDPETGYTGHWRDCDGIGYDPEEDIDTLSTCDVEAFYQNSERLNRLKMEPLRTLLFQNPKMAVYNELENAKLVYSSNDRSIRGQYEEEYCASLGQLVFRGLHIEDGWTFDATIAAIFMPFAALASTLIVLMAWLIYDDWAVAWNGLRGDGLAQREETVGGVGLSQGLCASMGDGDGDYDS
ncbi:hypothetical protein V502_10773 [Pseudogymnoascus sp. VKM F-4520 (FW-2644)]|nr:hypothetical protein V502_10773 [Pseudogymnoascus sp. VKM F-4520 (FW-2644)]